MARARETRPEQPPRAGTGSAATNETGGGTTGASTTGTRPRSGGDHRLTGGNRETLGTGPPAPTSGGVGQQQWPSLPTTTHPRQRGPEQPRPRGGGSSRSGSFRHPPPPQPHPGMRQQRPVTSDYSFALPVNIGQNPYASGLEKKAIEVDRELQRAGATPDYGFGIF